MVLLQKIVQIFICSMLYITPEYLTYCSWIGSMSVGCHLFGSVANDREGLLEKPLGRFHIAFLAQARINQIAISINSAIEIAPRSVNFDICLIHIPRSSRLSPSFYPQLV